MSAFIVSDEHIDALINFAISTKASYYFNPLRTPITRSNAQEIGQILLDENYRSVNHRYRESEQAPAYQFKFRLTRQHEAVAILKAIDCLDYQCCETDDWETTQAYAILAGIKAAAIRSLPGYETAKWGIS